jgi:6,7-dimethyl-8-ribityllumazine synthase
MTAGSGTLSMRTVEGSLDGKGLRIALVVSRFNDFIAQRLLEGALDCLRRHGVADKDITVARVPGAFEIPVTARRMALSRKVDAVVCVGCVIRGETSHYEQVCAEVARGVASVALEAGLPVTFGVLTTENLHQAIERAGAKGGNKGWDAALAAIEMVSLFRSLE